MWAAVLLLLCSATPLWAEGDMEVVYEWKDLKFKFPSVLDETWMKLKGRFIPGRAFPMDVESSASDPKGRVFVTTPRFFEGVPFTLSTVDAAGVLHPYPDAMRNREGECDSLTSVFRVRTDDCGRLWVVDTGRVGLERKCQAQVQVYRLDTDELVWQHHIPDSDLTPSSLLGSIELDLQGGCDKTFAYIADITGYGLVVLDAGARRSWRVEGNYFYPYPEHGHFNISGVEFDLMDGVVSLVLRSDTLYFHSFASVVETCIPAAQLRDPSAAHKFQQVPGAKSGQSGPAAITSRGVFMYSDLPDNSLRCWRVGPAFSDNTTARVYHSDEAFQFASGLKVSRDQNGTEWVWALTSRYQDVQAGKLNRSEVNFRILRAPVDKLTQGTVCAQPTVT